MVKVSEDKSSEDKKTLSYARKPESWVTVKEVVSANPNVEDKSFVSENGVPINKVIFVGVPEQTSMGENSSTAVMVDGGRDVLRVVAFGENMPMVEMLSRNAYSIVVGVLKYDVKRKNFYVTPSYIEPIPDAQRADFLRFWYLKIVELRALADQMIPRAPLARILDDEKIPYESVDGNSEWIKLKITQKEVPRMIVRSRQAEDDGFEKMKSKAIAFLRESFQKKEKLPYVEYLDWAGKNGINPSVADDVAMDLVNDGVIDQIDDAQTLVLKGKK